MLVAMEEATPATGAYLQASYNVDPRVLLRQIEEATSVDTLADCAARVDDLVSALSDAGVKVERIAALTCELNMRLFARLWSLHAPPDLMANSCLLVMGSEGRGEQIFKTDQDNALILRDGFACPGLAAVVEGFSLALSRLGYPPCPGRIMLVNPLWCQPLGAFQAALRGWVGEGKAAGLMNLAIFMDARAVAGDATLLARARDHLEEVLDPGDAFLARFASAIELFDAHPHWWQRLTAHLGDEAVDLKKLGTFPIVHGVRSLALQRRLRATGTAPRLRLLVQEGQLDEALARDVLDALHFLMALRLTHQLERRNAGLAPQQLVQPSELGTLARETLRSALGIVRHFRGVLEQRFQLNLL
jgi:CBS domain-containing protein